MRISFWLIPSERDRSFYQEVIDTLALMYDAPSFLPHVTVCSGLFPDDRADMTAVVTEVVQAAIANLAPFDLTIDAVRHSEQFTQTLYIAFQNHEPLNQLCDRLNAASCSAGATTDFHLEPHLSLIYSTLRIAQQQQLIDTLALPQRDIRFDAVSAVWIPTNEVRSREDVERWELLYTQKI